MKLCLFVLATAVLFSLVAADRTLTPFGYISKKCVFHVPEDHFVEDLGSLSVIKNEATDEIVQVVKPCSTSIQKRTTEFPEGWSAYVYAQATPPIKQYNGSWIVPAAPSEQESQVLFLFTGLQNSYDLADGVAVTNIIQPVLQWGESEAGGGEYWALASWYVDSNENAYYSKLTAQNSVNAGDTIQGNMFYVLASKVWTIQSIDVTTHTPTTLKIATNTTEPYAFVTLEVYNVDSCQDYPTGTVPFTHLAFDQFTPSWSTEATPGCGEKVSVGSATAVTITF